jgi:pilus assembly protein FimV
MTGLSDDRADQTEEIDLEDLGLDLDGLDEAARDMATGLQEVLPDGGNEIDFDLTGGGSPIASDESTEELEKNPTLGGIARAMGRDSGGMMQPEDTAEQPAMSDATIASRSLGATSEELKSLDDDLDLGEEDASDLTATGLRAIRDRRPEDPTMTEVGTKLDLARAYVDMGDPDGARSILNEVLEEGDPEQRLEARRMLDDLGS